MNNISEIIKWLKKYGFSFEKYFDASNIIKAQVNNLSNKNDNYDLDIFKYEASEKIKNILSDNQTSTFINLVDEYIERKKIKVTDFYRRSQITKQNFCRIRKKVNDSNTSIDKITRFTAMSTIIGLELDYDEAEQLLESCGLKFNKQNLLDCVIVYCLEHPNNWTMIKVNGIICDIKNNYLNNKPKNYYTLS